MMHFETYQGKCACNRNLKSQRTTNREKVTCSRCKKSDQYKMAKADESFFSNEKFYMIDESTLNKLIDIAKVGSECKIEFVDDFEEMKDNAFAIKRDCLFKVFEKLKKIKG